MSNEEKFWEAIDSCSFKELLAISRYIAESAVERFEGKEEIYDPYQFAEMLADYAEAWRGEE